MWLHLPPIIELLSFLLGFFFILNKEYKIFSLSNISGWMCIKRTLKIIKS